MGDVVLDVSHIGPAAHPAREGFIFAAMDMHLRPGKIRRAAAMVNVQVGQLNVAYVLRLPIEVGDLVNGGSLRVHVDTGIGNVEAHQP
jgi:hypothetical protein